jgi:cobalamin biosynthesis Mg chelatase CobN
LSIGKMHIDAPGVQLDASGVLNEQMAVRMVSTNLDELLPAINAFSKAPVKSLPIQLKNGNATFDGTLTGNLKSPLAVGALAFTNFLYSGIQFDRFSGQVKVDQSSADVRNGTLTRGAVQAQIAGNVGLNDWETEDLRLALLVFCFPPNKGNIGTAADLDVFPSLFEILSTLRSNGYAVDVPDSPDQLRERLLEGNSAESGMLANVAYRMSVDEYRSLCPYVDDIEREWGRAPGTINSPGREILVLGIQLGNVFIGVQPTFGYEGDPMRLLAAESGAPHHGFMALYTYLEKTFRADAVVHVGTHGAMEFMPGKQVGLSENCWPDGLIGELPNVYIYSVNNPSEGTIAKRRSYAELVSYLTPPIENAGLYKEFVSMKELLTAYRRADGDVERDRLFEAIEEKAQRLNL